MARRKVVATEEGEDLPLLDPTSGIAQVIHLMEWARVRNFRIGPTVQVGDTIVNIRDPHLDPKSERAAERETDIWKAHGYEE